jgi:hypothetical protein
VQSQRIEQALEVAQAEVDRIRLLVERGGYQTADLPQSVPETFTDEDLGNYPAPNYGTAVASTTTLYESLPPSGLRAVDLDGDGTNDYAIQVFRSPGTAFTPEDGTSDVLVAFGLGVRVYDIDAVDAQPSGILGSTPARASMTSGEGERGEKPLAVVYTRIARGDSQDTYCNYFNYTSTQTSSFTGSNPQYCD